MFLKTVNQKLNLNATAYSIRAEEAGRKEEFRERFKIATARAVSKLNILCEYCVLFLEKGGILVALKGPNYEEELKDAKRAIEELGCVLKRVEIYKLKNNTTRSLILIEKISHTSTRYPRTHSKISKNSFKNVFLCYKISNIAMKSYSKICFILL